MVKNSLVFLVILAMALFVQPVRADVLYDSGVAWGATNGQLGISGTGASVQYAADPFTLSSASTITSIDLGLWNNTYPSNAPSTLSYEILGTTTGSAALYTGTVTLTTLDQDGVERFKSEFSLNATLNAGTYYLRLYNGTTATGDNIGWGGNQLLTSAAWSGSTTTWDFRQLPYNAFPESFIINGTTGSSPVPLPPSLFLLGPGLVGLAAIRRRFKK